MARGATESKRKNKTADEMKSFLSKVPDEKRFFCADGKIFSDMIELQKAMNKMSKKTFSHHVNSEKNDFSNWIYDVIADVKLADDLRKSTDQKILAKKIKTRIDYIKRKIKF